MHANIRCPVAAAQQRVALTLRKTVCVQSEGVISLVTSGYTVGKPKGTRKLHPHAMRLDVDGEAGVAKFVFAAETSQELEQWILVLRKEGRERSVSPVREAARATSPNGAAATAGSPEAKPSLKSAATKLQAAAAASKEFQRLRTSARAPPPARPRIFWTCSPGVRATFMRLWSWRCLGRRLLGLARTRVEQLAAAVVLCGR